MRAALLLLTCLTTLALVSADLVKLHFGPATSTNCLTFRAATLAVFVGPCTDPSTLWEMDANQTIVQAHGALNKLNDTLCLGVRGENGVIAGVQRCGLNDGVRKETQWWYAVDHRLALKDTSASLAGRELTADPGICLDLQSGRTDAYAPVNVVQAWECQVRNPNQEWTAVGVNGARMARVRVGWVLASVAAVWVAV